MGNITAPQLSSKDYLSETNKSPLDWKLWLESGVVNGEENWLMGFDERKWDGQSWRPDLDLKVNGEDVQGLSHARVIGMLRKITGAVELDIKRPTKLYMADSAIASPKSSVGSSGATRAPLERAPHSVDLDITLEDKDKTLTGSTDVQDEDDVTELLNAISAANNNSSPSTNHIQPKPPTLQKRDTDTVLSSLLSSLEPPPSPPESLLSVDPREFDSQWESGYSDNDVTPDLVPNQSLQFFKSRI
ncbi:hypothetical protein OS493_040155 [Desmophyllum pertusum]|uniref:Uncharacterized protein n=1 Tax=Desmophyllum pertusum TaxID=174260 RepID=A0A9W9Y802_9CNID|nr:hypothetical protein OS493_040155 [Desmophyllum pertusum]